MRARIPNDEERECPNVSASCFGNCFVLRASVSYFDMACITWSVIALTRFSDRRPVPWRLFSLSR